MTDKSALHVAILFVTLVVVPAGLLAAEGRKVSIGYLTRASDPFYSASGGYTGVYGRGREPALAGAKLAIKDARLIGRSLGLGFALMARELEDRDTASGILRQMLAEDGIVAAILDLPETEVREAALQLADVPVVLFNIRQRSLSLRRDTCSARLFHVIPSEAMLADGLVQHLVSLGWREVLELEGETPQDRLLAQAFEASAGKFGLAITDKKTFAESNDPRRREESNIRLLLSGESASVVFVADATREYARFVPYNTSRPVLVVGSAGLVPAAWDSLWERQGAPQLNKRFLKTAGRPMLDEDWASWVAVRSVVEVLRRAPDIGGSAMAEALLDPELRLELYKGYPGSYRSWDHQLRQPVLLTTGEAVAGLAPVEGVLHKTNVLDTLGLDEPEFRCGGN